MISDEKQLIYDNTIFFPIVFCGYVFVIIYKNYYKKGTDHIPRRCLFLLVLNCVVYSEANLYETINKTTTSTICHGIIE